MSQQLSTAVCGTQCVMQVDVRSSCVLWSTMYMKEIQPRARPGRQTVKGNYQVHRVTVITKKKWKWGKTSTCSSGLEKTVLHFPGY